MPVIETSQILIELPDEWTVFEDGGQLVAHGPENLEVIATTVACRGGDRAEQENALELTKSRFADLMQMNANHPELIITTKKSERLLENGVLLAKLSCTTLDESIVFDQFVLAKNNEVLFLTYEGPVSAKRSRDLFQSAIESAALR